MVLTFPVITFGAIALAIGSATVLMPMIKSGITRSRRRRRSKSRKNRQHVPRQRIDLTSPPPQSETPPGSSADTG
ncbi:MAG: hypothetical protein WC729_04895 [Sphingomonas sp.]|jgi:hypothetical protein|uniref:hypothetical protein n=1 Tax=Sphingomonas sp. TaxID=28214 RepID=UPI003567BFFE